CSPILSFVSFTFLTDTAPTQIYTLSLHDALPIFGVSNEAHKSAAPNSGAGQHPTDTVVDSERPNTVSNATSTPPTASASTASARSEEHTSELQSRENLVCRLLLEKKKITRIIKSV